MKRTLYLILALLGLVLLPCMSRAQSGPYGNEWINHSLTYYKFKVGSEGIYRISRAALDSAGLPASIAANRMMLFRDGQEVPIYTSTTGQMGAADYLEFYAYPNTGLLDAELYVEASRHANDRNSLFSDSAAYFLTYDNNTNHARYSQQGISIPTGLTPQRWCYVTTGHYYKNVFAPGRSYAAGHAFYSSQFDRAEGFIQGWVSPASVSATISLPTPGLIDSAGLQAQLHSSVIGLSYNNYHYLQLKVNNQVVADSAYGVADTKRFNLSFAASLLDSISNQIVYAPYAAGSGYDQYGVSFVELRYPRDFNVSGKSYFRFSLDNSASNQYLVFQGFDAGGALPRLYDLTNKHWYAADTSVSGQCRFYLNPSATGRELLLYSPASNPPVNLSSVKTIQFTNFGTAANQGNYVIITHPELMQPFNSHNYINEYKTYRQSAAGGSHSVVVADITELYDQFAYGTDIHPLAIRHLMQYAHASWGVKPDYLMLIGRGILYHKYKDYLANRAQYPFPIVPTYGHPGSDVNFVNFGDTGVLHTRVGRLSAWNAQEVGIYLEKLKAYEAALQPPVVPDASWGLWQKQVLHIAGASSPQLQQMFLLPTLNDGASILQDTLKGAHVVTIAKSPGDPDANKAAAQVDSMLSTGSMGLVTFHGHATAGGFDYNLNDPQMFENSPRFPAFLALGCDVAQIFELSNKKTISELYVDDSSGGSIVMIAADNLGFTNFHYEYLINFYQQLGRHNYGASLGHQYKATYDSIYLANPPGNSSNFSFAHLESMLYQGDPAIRMYAPDKPDFHISASGLRTIPGSINTSLDSFKLQIVSYNLGKATADSVTVKVEQLNPAGQARTVGQYVLHRLLYTDTTVLNLPLHKLHDPGMNRIRVRIDPGFLIAEASETNNTDSIEVYIYADQLQPQSPHEFAIVNQQGVTLRATTLTPFRPLGTYRMQIDTTELFNSALMQQTTVQSSGGVIAWTPSLTLQDSVVYYWRAAFDSAINGQYQWTGSSFIYLPGSSTGWNQSHYFQFLKNGYFDLGMQADRKFRFQQNLVKISAINKIMYTNADVDNARVMVDDIDRQRSTCNFNGTLQIMVFDTLTGQPWANTSPSFAGAMPANCNPSPTRGKVVFEYPLHLQSYREAARNFLDSIPDGYYVLVRNVIWDALYVPSYAASWLADTSVYGSGNSLYHELKQMGFSKLDSFNSKRAFIFMTKKGSGSFQHYQAFADPSSQDILSQHFLLPISSNAGTMYSTTIGPAKDWHNLVWRSGALDNLGQNDLVKVRITGIDSNNQETVLLTDTARNISLNAYSASQYPNMRLEWLTEDTTNRTSAQLHHWRVLYDPVPEAALNPARHFVRTDTVWPTQNMQLSIALDNLTDVGMDSMLVRFRLLDANGASHLLGQKKFRPLGALDSLHITYNFNTNSWPGKNILIIEANPGRQQPEQYLPNNVGYLPFFVQTLPLPVDLLSFTAEKQESRALLRWQTASEQNSDYFSIERSADGRSFSAIGREAAAGTSAWPLSYQHYDQAPKTGLNYYRLRMHMLDGTSRLSATAVLHWGDAASQWVSLAPQPGRQWVGFTITAPLSAGTLRIYDMSGRQLRHYNFTTTQGQAQLVVDRGSLAAGMYSYRISTAEGQELFSGKMLLE